MSAPREIAIHPLGGAKAAPAAGAVVTVPGVDIPLLSFDLPNGVKGAAREAVARRQLRDRIGIAADAAELRPFVQEGQGNLWRQALVADLGLVAHWRSKVPRDCRAVLPDYLTLPAAKSLCCLSFDPAAGQVLARIGTDDGFAAEDLLAEVMLRRALQHAAERPKAILVVAGPPPDWLDGLGAEFALAVVRDEAGLAALGGAQPLRFAHGELALDLRSDPQAARSSLRRNVLTWRWPLVCGLLAAMLWAAAQVTAYRAISAEVQRETKAMLERVREDFVPNGPILDVRAQVVRAIDARRDAVRDWQGRVSPLTILGQVARVLDNQGALAEEIVYSEDEGLSLVLRVANFAAAEDLIASLSSSGLTVDLIDQRVDGAAQGVRVEVQVQSSSADGTVTP